METKKMLEIQMLTVNEKAKDASILMDQHKDSTRWRIQLKFEFYYGQYMAYVEVYTMLKNMLDHET